MLRLLERAGERHVSIPSLTSTDYVNTIPTENEPWFPGDEELERNFRRLIRWNAAIMVHRAQRPGIGVGGHLHLRLLGIALRSRFGPLLPRPGAPPAAATRSTSKDMPPRASTPAHSSRAGSPSRSSTASVRTQPRRTRRRPAVVPHPRLMPDFWQFPTVSMGLGPMNAIAQARVNHYLHDRGIKDTSDQHVWAFLGDGEMDEPESRGLLQIAATEGLDNLTFVVNCSLQRLDGPVRGSRGRSSKSSSRSSRGAGWNVVKVVWGREWDALLHADRDGALVNLMNSTPDGDYQTYRANDGAFVREHFFSRDPAPRNSSRTSATPDLEPQARRPRLPQAVRRLHRRNGAQGPADGDPRQDDQRATRWAKHFEGRNATIR